MDSLANYRRALTQAIAFDLSHFGKLSVQGMDRSTFLQNFTTNDVIKPGVGSGCESFLTTAQARIVAWLRVAIRPDELYLTMEPGIAAKVDAHLQRYLIAEDVQLSDRTETDLLFHLCGPEIFQNLPEPMQVAATWQPWQNAFFTFDDLKVWLQRCDFLGLSGLFLSAPREQNQNLQSFFKNHNLSVVSGSDAAWEMLRLEAGTPAYGIDFDETNLPQEVNRTEQAISFTKGCYIGQETVARIRAYGHVNRLLLGIKLATSDLQSPENSSWSGGKLFHQDKEVGVLKSVAFSPRLQSLLAFAMVRREYSPPGTQLTARSTIPEVETEVVALPV